MSKNSICYAIDCKKPVYQSGRCLHHNFMFRFFGSVEYGKDTVEDKFWQRVEQTQYCWLWVGGVNKEGYGYFTVNGKSLRAHRWSYEYLIGKIPDELVIDHMCRVRNCVNPDHLEAVTSKENILRGHGRWWISSQLTHCHRGHPFSGDNLAYKKSGQRRCRECERILSNIRYHSKKIDKANVTP